MSCASSSLVLRLALLITIFIVSCSFVASIVWLLRTKGLGNRYESYYLSRINITSTKNEESDTNSTLSSPVPDHYKDLIKIEIAMRRVEENSRRLKEYSKSLLWDNKDKSLWCMLFKDSERSRKESVKRKAEVDEAYIFRLRQTVKATVIHLRHHGGHHHRRPDTIPDYIK